MKRSVCSKKISKYLWWKKLQKFTCGVKHNFDSGVIIDSDDRKNEWNCTTCELQGKTITKEELKVFKTSGKANCPILTYE